MKPFIFSIIFLSITSITLAQKKELVLKESYNVDNYTTLDIDIDNVSIVFEESNDNKIHFDYFILFDEDSKKTQFKVFNGLNASSVKTDNTVKLNVKNSMYLGELYSLDIGLEAYKKYIRDIFSTIKKNQYQYKSKDSLLKEIGFSKGSYVDDYFKKLKIENPNKDWGKSVRKFKQYFAIKVPKYVKIKIKTLHSKIEFKYDIEKSFILNSFKTHLKFKKILGKENRIIASNGIFQAEEINNGRIEFLDMNKVVIGEVSNMSIATETSKIQIGEVGKNVDFNDFNSKLYLYNFSKNFTKFNLKGDYSKLSFYKVVETNFSMDISGHNTVLNMNEIKASFGVNKEEKLIKILQKKRNENVPFLGNIEVVLKNGILNIK
ncbi:hypothetical protein BXQ17_11205 [Polaribacter sp. BM10]|uniref:hypothetical protein n=1 Tax=Polaribacter sp. BM10 TaxID=1529069 RepID=UPI00098B6815|nr:hypothetical protein [Polaribacter sp. BM10]AQS94602.1 hypothetical protein BXQ17_11205 [Polaribacter sp. BM10]